MLTGESEGEFDLLKVRDASGNMVNILSLLGGGAVTSATQPLHISNGVMSINLANYSTTAQMNTAILNALTSYVTTTILTNTLASYTDTTSLNTLLGTKQNTLTAGSNITISNNTISSNALVLQLDGVTQNATTLNFVQNNASLSNNVLNISRLTHYDKISLKNQASIKDLTQGSSGELLWNGQELQLRQNAFHQINAILPVSISGSNILTIESLWKPSNVMAGTGVVTNANNTLGTLTLGVDTNTIATQSWVTGNFLSPLNPGTVGVMQGLTSVMTANTWIISVDETTDSRTQFILRDSNNTARNITANISGQLLYNNTTLATETQLATKQNTLNNYTETTGSTTTIFQGADDATPLSSHLSWTSGTYTNVPNSHQLITIPVYHRFTGIGSGTCYMTIQLKAGTTNEAVFAVNDSTAWIHVSEIKFSNLSTTNWTTVSWSFSIPPNGNVNFHIGYIPPGSSLTQASGNILIKNLRLYKTGAISTISSQLHCQEDVICSKTLTATGYASTSDQSIKNEIQDASLDDCKHIFDNVNVKTYVRKDVSGSRIGFIAQDVQTNAPAEFANLLGMQYGGDEPLLSLDYSRLVCVLWGVCKHQETDIAMLTHRITALEGNSIH